MPMAFPPIRPYRRTYTPGRFPRGEFRALNGAVTVIDFGNRRTDATLDTGFQNVTDTRAAAVMKLYEDSQQVNDWLIFTPADVLAGVGTDLQPWMAEVISGLRWRFAEPPAVESVQPGLSSISCRFVAQMDAS